MVESDTTMNASVSPDKGLPASSLIQEDTDNPAADLETVDGTGDGNVTVEDITDTVVHQSAIADKESSTTAAEAPITTAEASREDEEAQDTSIIAEEDLGDPKESLFNYDIPLPETIRPTCLKDYIGQEHLMGPNGRINDFIKLQYLPSMILYGPPGVGKTTLASILARETGYVFVELNATDGTLDDLKHLSKTIEKENIKRENKGVDYLSVVVFIDEIHRFRINQQDFLLPLIETGQFVFIGATTVNPKVKIRRAILSRCQVFELKSLNGSHLLQILDKALIFENIRRRSEKNLNFLSFNMDLKNKLVEYCKGDSRKLISSVQFISSNFQTPDLNYTGSYSPLELDTSVLHLLDFKPKVNVNGLYKQLFDSIKTSSFKKNIRPKLVFTDSKPTSFTVRIKYRHKVNDLNDNFHGNEKKYILPTDTKKQFQDASHMEFSDDDDEPETKTAGILSDSESDYEPIKRTSGKADLVECICIALRLLKHESPLSFIRNLLLFSVIDVDDYSLLPKVVALMKCLSKVNVNVLKSFNNLIEKLCKSKKIPYPQTVKFKMALARSYLESEIVTPPEIGDHDISFDQSLVDSLLTPPICKMEDLPAKNNFQIASWDSNAFLGEPLANQDDFMSLTDSESEVTDSDAESPLSPITTQILDTYDYSDRSFILLSDSSSSEETIT